MQACDYAKHALVHARFLSKGGRGSATRAEAQAADYVCRQLAEIGVADVHVQPFSGLRSDYLFLALVLGLALLGHAAHWLLRSPLGVWPETLLSLAAFGTAAFALWRKYTFRSYPFRQLLPHGPSRNVIAVIPPAAESPLLTAKPHRLVLIAHLDSHRAVWWYAADGLVVAYLLATPAVVGGLFVSPALYLLAELLHWPALAWAALPFAGLCFLGWFTGLTADLGPYSPGANDNAAAVGTLLALAERLQREPLRQTEVWLVFTGCEETGCDGMKALLDTHGAALQEALFVDFELVGIGERVVYLRDEGIMRRKRIPAEVEQLVIEAGAPHGLQPRRAAGLGALTEIGVALERGYAGVCVLMGRAQSPLLPEWHRLSDTAEHLQPEALGRIHQVGWSILQKVDRQGLPGVRVK